MVSIGRRHNLDFVCTGAAIAAAAAIAVCLGTWYSYFFLLRVSSQAKLFTHDAHVKPVEMTIFHFYAMQFAPHVFC